MKIIFVSNIAWSLYNFRRGLMLELKASGHEVIACAARDEHAGKLEALGFRFIPLDLERKGTNIFKDAALFISFVRIYREEKPGLIFHNSVKPNIYGAMAARFTGCRAINTVSGLGYAFIRRTFLTLVIRGLYRIASACAQKTFFQNKDDRDLFVADRIIDPARCALVAGSGVDTEYFRRTPAGRSSAEGQGFIFLYMGRILWDKGIGELIDAVRDLKRRGFVFKVRFLGMIDAQNPAGIDRAQVQAWQDEGLIEYLKDTADVRPYLEDSDCLVLPSYREGISRALLEAGAMELPVITTDVPGCRDVVEAGQTGFLVRPRDPDDLAQGMEKMMRLSVQERKDMGSRARARIVREFSERVVVSAYCDCLEQ